MLSICIYLDHQVFYVVGLGVMHYLYELQHSSSLSRKYSEAVCGHTPASASRGEHVLRVSDATQREAWRKTAELVTTGGER